MTPLQQADHTISLQSILDKYSGILSAKGCPIEKPYVIRYCFASTKSPAACGPACVPMTAPSLNCSMWPV